MFRIRSVIYKKRIDNSDKMSKDYSHFEISALLRIHPSMIQVFTIIGDHTDLQVKKHRSKLPIKLYEGF
jgi:hypothetical protein